MLIDYDLDRSEGLCGLHVTLPSSTDLSFFFALSKPITRRQYVLVKVVGLWVLLAVFMLVLQAIVVLTVFISAKVVIPGYPFAALLYCLNLLFMVVAVLLLSLLMPETAAFLCIIGIAVAGLIIDGINSLGSSQIAQTMTDSTQTDLSLGRILYYVWPKLSGMQYFAPSFIGGGGFQGLWSAYPLFNVLLYCVIFCAPLFWRFRKEEIV